MAKIWAKIITDHKVKASTLYDCGEEITATNFWAHVKAICEELKIPTPVLLYSYSQQFLEFNLLKLKNRDFMEEIPFDLLQLENG